MDHIIVCIYDLLKKHILTLISTNEEQVNIYNDIKSLIFQCVQKRYLYLENPSYIMKNYICDCISILIISGITFSWQNCVEDLIQDAENNKNKNPELIYICLRSIADCDSIMNFMKDANDNDDNYWDDSLNLQKQKKFEIKEKLMSKKEIIFKFIYKVYMDINICEKNFRIRIIKAIIDLIIFYNQLDANLFVNEKNMSSISMELINQSINMNISDNIEENIQILKNISDLVSNCINNLQSRRLYEFYGKADETNSIEENLQKIFHDVNTQEKSIIEYWLNFVLNILENNKYSKNNNKNILWSIAKIFSSILENFIFLFFDLNVERNILMFNWFKILISENRMISWMFFNTIDNMSNYIIDYFRFNTYSDHQKKEFAELLINILLNIMNNCSYNKLIENDFSQLQKEILFLNNESNWNSEIKNYMIGEENITSIDDIDISEYRNSAEYAFNSIYYIFKSGFNSKEYQLMFFQKLLSLLNLEINIGNNKLNNLHNDNLVRLDTILFVLKSIIKLIDVESSSDIILFINDFIKKVFNSIYIQNTRIFIDYLILVNQFSYLNSKNLQDIITKLLSITKETKNNKLLLDSCYIVMSNLCKEFKKNIFYKDYFEAFYERYKIFCTNYSLNNISQIKNLIKSMFFSLGINNDNDYNNEQIEIKNLTDEQLNKKIEDIITPLLHNQLINQAMKEKNMSILKNCIIKSFILYKEIFYHVSLCSQNIRSNILNGFISDNINNIIEFKKDSVANNSIKIFNLFPKDEEVFNSILDFYISNSLNIVEDCPKLIPLINEVFIQLFKSSCFFFKVIDFFGCFYKYILKKVSENDNDYFDINKYILEHFILIINLSINYLNSNNEISGETFNKINLLMTTIIDIFPNIHINEINGNIFNNIIQIMKFFFELIEFLSKTKSEEINDKLISNIIKSLSSILNKNILKILSNTLYPEQKNELLENILFKTLKLLYLNKFGYLSNRELPLLYHLISFIDINIFSSLFSKLLRSIEIFNDLYINNIQKYIQIYYNNKSNIIDFFNEIVTIIINKKEPDCLEFYFNRLNFKKI